MQAEGFFGEEKRLMGVTRTRINVEFRLLRACDC